MLIIKSAMRKLTQDILLSLGFRIEVSVIIQPIFAPDKENKNL